jgi:hypothetical protein
MMKYAKKLGKIIDILLKISIFTPLIKILIHTK